MNRIKINMMETCELMEYLKLSIRQYKYDRLTYEEYMELGEAIDYAIERLESKHKLLALPYKLQLGRW